MDIANTISNAILNKMFHNITIENEPTAPLLDDNYCCAYYKLEGRTLTMYASDSTVSRVIVINVNANCKIRKTY